MTFNTCCFGDSHSTAIHLLYSWLQYWGSFNNYDKLKENHFKIILRKKTFYMYFMCTLCKKLYIKKLPQYCSHEYNGCIAVEWESSKQHVLNVITIVITWRWPVGAETCSEVLRNKEVVSCVCGPYIYTFILYVYIVSDYRFVCSVEIHIDTVDTIEEYIDNVSVRLLK
jgi:hypothetical protein